MLKNPGNFSVSWGLLTSFVKKYEVSSSSIAFCGLFRADTEVAVDKYAMFSEIGYKVLISCLLLCDIT